MLFAVKMDVHIPLGMEPGLKAEILARERAYSQELQKSGVWPHIWRCVGQYANLSIFDVEDNGHLHDLLSKLPLFEYMTIDVTPLTVHPSDIALLPTGPQ